MKKIAILAMVAGFLFAANHELNVPNMGCGHCAKKIENAVKNLPGFKSMSYDLKTKDVNITTDDKVKSVDVAKAIANSKEKKFRVGIKEWESLLF